MTSRIVEITTRNELPADNPVGEIMISSRTRIGARVSALSGMAVGKTAVTMFPSALNDTTSSMYTVY